MSYFRGRDERPVDSDDAQRAERTIQCLIKKPMHGIRMATRIPRSPNRASFDQAGSVDARVQLSLGLATSLDY